ncbi:hypothetical protein CY0110_18547 [Crocosphaera chwakensis CCY0110]|uniref:Uncharacterized protein n=1 Tax=Crocosphaera chwakensis CCY0110 TaxID=391612 RepID=A3IJ41_9CHRO|nr:hypothetical protein CY0110_18547 [Crocosphaera chwakensis CCY0110]
MRDRFSCFIINLKISNIFVPNRCFTIGRSYGYPKDSFC